MKENLRAQFSKKLASNKVEVNAAHPLPQPTPILSSIIYRQCVLGGGGAQRERRGEERVGGGERGAKMKRDHKKERDRRIMKRNRDKGMYEC